MLAMWIGGDLMCLAAIRIQPLHASFTYSMLANGDLL